MLPIRQPNPMIAQMLQGMTPMMNRPQGGMMPPQLSPIPQAKMPEDNSMQRGLGMLAMGMQNRQPVMQQWQPQNQAADLIANGTYADPLLRQSAQWGVPGQGGGLLNWLRGVMG